MEDEHLGPISDQTSAVKEVLGLAIGSEDAPITKVPREVSHPPGLGPIAVFNLEYGRMKSTTLSAGVQAPFHRQIKPRARPADFYDHLTENNRARNPRRSSKDGATDDHVEPGWQAPSQAFQIVKREVLSRARAAGFVDLKLEQLLDKQFGWAGSKAQQCLRRSRRHSGLFIPFWLQELKLDAVEMRMMSWILFLFDDQNSVNPDEPRNRRTKGKNRKEVVEMSPEAVDRYTRQYRSHRKGMPCRAWAMRDLVVPAADGTNGVYRVRCLEKTVKQLADAIGVSEKVGRRVLHGLAAKGAIIIVGDSDHHGITDEQSMGKLKARKRGVLLLPSGIVLAMAWCRWKIHDDSEVERTIDLQIDWYGSEYRRTAMNRDGRTYYPSDALDHNGLECAPKFRKAVPGVWVDDRVYAACDGNAGAAMVMSQLLWYMSSWKPYRYASEHELNPGLKELEIVPKFGRFQDGRRYMIRGLRFLSRKLGLSYKSVAECASFLSDGQSRTWKDRRDKEKKTRAKTIVGKNFFTVKKWPVACWNGTTTNGVLHWSPNPDAIYKAIVATRSRARELREMRFGTRRKE